jgi:hypothetical protein
MIYPEIVLLAIIAFSLLSFLFLLLFYLMIRKVNEIKKRKAIESYKSKINPLIFSAIAEGQVDRGITCRTGVEQKAIEELLGRYVKILEGVEEKERLSALATLCLTGYYRKHLKSKRWSQRMNALYHIEDFQIKELLEDIVVFSKKKSVSQQELIHVLRILAAFQFSGLKDLLPNHYHYLSEYEYRSIFMRLDENLFDQFVLSFHKSASRFQYAILDVISLKGSIKYRPFIEDVFASYSGEVKLRALKALTEVGYVKNIDPCLALLYSSKWQERMVAAKLVGSIKEEKGIPRLIELLQDQTWWVRSQAGHSLSQFPNGREILQSVFETSKDPFAKDMAWDWLHKGV